MLRDVELPLNPFVLNFVVFERSFPDATWHRQLACKCTIISTSHQLLSFVNVNAFGLLG